MAKMIDIRTMTRAITPATQEFVHQEQLEYLNNGYELFDTHYMGIVGPEAMFAYIFVKYEDASIVNFDASKDVAPRKRGRPAKQMELLAVEA
jgi:hypothetical protein